MRFSIKDDIYRIVHKKGVGRQLEAVLVCGFGQNALDCVFKGSKTSWFKASRYISKTKTLEVLLGGAVNPQKIRAETKNIILKINQKAGSVYVENIRFRLE